MTLRAARDSLARTMRPSSAARPRSLVLPLAGLFALLASARPAAADVPPPDGYVETCTVETQQGLGGGPCESVSTYHGAVDSAADRALLARGLEPRCAGGGATVGYALYCAGPATSAAPPASQGCGRCEVGTAREGSRARLFALVAAGLLALRLRRRR